MAKATTSEMTAQRECPAGCGRQVTVVAELEFGAFDGLPLDPSAPLVVCSTCGQAYRDGDFGQAALDEFYQDHGFYAAAPTAAGGMYPWDLERYSLSLSVIERHLQGDHPTIIDVGCGNGGFISQATRYGYDNLFGVDLTMARVEHVRHICSLPAALGSAAKLPYPDLTPDLLVYSHVLDHVFDPQQALEHAAKRLSDGGLVYLEVADASRYAELPVGPFHWLAASERVNHFDAPHLANLGRRSGFDPLETGQLTVQIASEIEIPVAYAVLGKAAPQSAVPDFSLQDALVAHVASQQEAIAAKRATFDKLAAAGSPVIVWGVGHELFSLIHLTGLGRCKLVGLVDDQPSRQERTVAGHVVTSPERLAEASADHTVVITSPGQPAAREAQLKDIGFPGQIVALG